MHEVSADGSSEVSPFVIFQLLKEAVHTLKVSFRAGGHLPHLLTAAAAAASKTTPKATSATRRVREDFKQQPQRKNWNIDEAVTKLEEVNPIRSGCPLISPVLAFDLLKRSRTSDKISSVNDFV